MTSPLPVRGRAGISLLEVLISMFILAVGIVSVLSLFTAGREIQARANIISRAVSFADQMASTADSWREVGEWQARAPDGTFGWANMPVAGLQLPVVIDPYGLNADTGKENPTGWDWGNFADIRDPLGEPLNWRSYFRRITLPKLPRSVSPDPAPLAFEEAISLFADADAVEYAIPTDPRRPPENQFELDVNDAPLRRKRGGDLSPALMISDQGEIGDGSNMRYWLLVFHKQPRGYDEDESASQSWPQGCLRFDVINAQNGLVELTLDPARRPKDNAALRRGLQPGRWLMLTRRNGSGWMVEWTKMTSVTVSGNGWLVVPAEAPDPATGIQPVAFVFDSLVYVRRLRALDGKPLKKQP